MSISFILKGAFLCQSTDYAHHSAKTISRTNRKQTQQSKNGKAKWTYKNLLTTYPSYTPAYHSILVTRPNELLAVRAIQNEEIEKWW